MKKYGKYEKMPQVKSTLLQTYFLSLVCLVLCVTMFFGTTYAWFTSEVNNTANEIYVGTLKVGFYKGEPAEENSLDDSNNKNNKLFDSSICWEPGYTALETITIRNEGDLAFKYELSFTEGSLAGESKMDISNVAENFEVRVYEGTLSSSPASYADITEKNGWSAPVSLADLLSGKELVLQGKMTAKEQCTYTIALHMEEAVSAQIMGEKISLNVRLIAYQMGSEKDGFGNEDYDGGMEAVSNAGSLQSALREGATVQLISDVNIDKAEDRVTMQGGILYGNTKKITYSGDKVSGASVGVLTTSGGAIKNLTIDGGVNGRALYITELTSDLSVSDCVLSGAYSFNLNSDQARTEYTLTFENTTFEDWTSYANVVKHASFTDCTFKDVLRPYGETVLTNCVFTKEGLDVSKLEKGETITLINCTYNGEPVEKAVLTAGDEGITVTESDLVEIKDGKLVLKTNG